MVEGTRGVGKATRRRQSERCTPVHRRALPVYGWAATATPSPGTGSLERKRVELLVPAPRGAPSSQPKAGHPSRTGPSACLRARGRPPHCGSVSAP
eukprot:scaffold44_cov411-Prasinococcus_capsulatus_cf.AAC.20